jgi:hypothetical protein
MPTQDYTDGYNAGFLAALDLRRKEKRASASRRYGAITSDLEVSAFKPKKRKLSAWNKYVKANSNKPRFRLRSGKLNLKKMGVAFRKTPAGKKKRR